MKILEIPLSGDIVTHELDEQPTLEWMRERIDCDTVEFVRVFFHGKYTYMLIDETGLLKPKPFVNVRATSVYHCNMIHHEGLIPDSPIVGTALLITEGTLE